MINLIPFFIWIIALIYMPFFWQLCSSLKTRHILLFFILFVILGSLALFKTLTGGEEDLAWLSLFFSPLFYLYAILAIIKYFLRKL